MVKDVPLFMPYEQYDTLGQAAKRPNAPITWKLTAPRDFSEGTSTAACRVWLVRSSVLLGCIKGRRDTFSWKSRGFGNQSPCMGLEPWPLLEADRQPRTGTQSQHSFRHGCKNGSAQYRGCSRAEMTHARWLIEGLTVWLAEEKRNGRGQRRC